MKYNKFYYTINISFVCCLWFLQNNYYHKQKQTDSNTFFQNRIKLFTQRSFHSGILKIFRDAAEHVPCNPHIEKESIRPKTGCCSRIELAFAESLNLTTKRSAVWAKTTPSLARFAARSIKTFSEQLWRTRRGCPRHRSRKLVPALPQQCPQPWPRNLPRCETHVLENDCFDCLISRRFV